MGRLPLCEFVKRMLFAILPARDKVSLYGHSTGTISRFAGILRPFAETVKQRPLACVQLAQKPIGGLIFKA